MTINYSSEVATAEFGTFGRLLFRWKASVYQLIWREMVVFISFYTLIAIIYRVVLDCEQQSYFEAWAIYCKDNAKLFPLTVVLVYYVYVVFARWMSMFDAIRYPDRACYAVLISITDLTSYDTVVIQCRRAIARYLNLAQVLVFRDVSTSVKTRFPTLNSLVAEGFMTKNEKLTLEKLRGENRLERHHKYWLVVQWVTDTLRKIEERGSIRDEYLLELAFKEILDFGDYLATLLRYDWVNIPLAYTQVVMLVICGYFAVSLMSGQYLMTKRNATCTQDVEILIAINQSGNETGSIGGTTDHQDVYTLIQLYFPLFTVLEFLFYGGLIKMAETILNPFGKDDDDFEMNHIIDRNLAVSYGILDCDPSTSAEDRWETAPTAKQTKLKAKRQKGSAYQFMPSGKDEGGKSADEEKGNAAEKMPSVESGSLEKHTSSSGSDTTTGKGKLSI